MFILETESIEKPDKSLKGNEIFFKKCLIITEADSKGFGFKINKELKPKHTICYVDENSAAKRANVVETDVLIEINSKNIRQEKFENIKESIIKASKTGRIELLLISKNGYSWYKQKNKRFSQASKLISSANLKYFTNENKGIFLNISTKHCYC